MDSPDKQEVLLLPQLIIRPQSPNEEMDYLWFVLKSVPLYKKFGYTIGIPDHPEFKKLVNISPNFEEVDKDAIKKLFVEQLYDPEFYKAGVVTLENERLRIEKAFPGFVEFNEKWGFKLFPQYLLALTRYGPGGSYNAKTGKIIIKTREKETYKKSPASTPVHEMVHIGIDDGIVKKYGLIHEEKERLVDLITLKKFGHFLTGYWLQNLGDSRIDPYITDEALNNLPIAVEKYVKDFPRDH